jgi:hypothetical protein
MNLRSHQSPNPNRRLPICPNHVRQAGGGGGGISGGGSIPQGNQTPGKAPPKSGMRDEVRLPRNA